MPRSPNTAQGYPHQQQATFITGASVAAMAATAVGGRAGEMGEFLKDLAAIWDKNLDRNRRQIQKRMYTEVAKSAQEAVKEKYSGTHRLNSSYRYADPGGDDGGFRRFSNGAMWGALNDEGAMFYASDNGIQFINRTEMDRRAKQWYRLNFGARPRSTPRAAQTTITFFGQSFPGPSLSEYGPSGAFRIPQGVFSNAQFGETPYESASLIGKGGKSKGAARNFYPSALMDNYNPNLPAFRRTQGIRGTNHFDAGIKRIADDLPRAMEKVAVSWLEEAAVGRSFANGSERAPGGPFSLIQTSNQALKRYRSLFS